MQTAYTFIYELKLLNTLWRLRPADLYAFDITGIENIYIMNDSLSYDDRYQACLSGDCSIHYEFDSDDASHDLLMHLMILRIIKYPSGEQC